MIFFVKWEGIVTIEANAARDCAEIYRKILELTCINPKIWICIFENQKSSDFFNWIFPKPASNSNYQSSGVHIENIYRFKFITFPQHFEVCAVFGLYVFEIQFLFLTNNDQLWQFVFSWHLNRLFYETLIWGSKFLFKLYPDVSRDKSFSKQNRWAYQNKIPTIFKFNRCGGYYPETMAK